VTRVVLPGIPTRDVVAMIEHLDDVIRELSIIAAGATSGTARSAVPASVLGTMERVRPVLFAQKENISIQATRAWKAGAASFDLEVDLPEGAAPTVLEVLKVFEAVDDAAVGDGAFLLPAASPDLFEFRHWFFTRVAEDLETASAALKVMPAPPAPS